VRGALEHRRLMDLFFFVVDQLSLFQNFNTPSTTITHCPPTFTP
jgi:hypothetical protein